MNGKSISVVNLVLVTLPVIGSLILDIDRLIGNVVCYITAMSTHQNLLVQLAYRPLQVGPGTP